MFLKTFIYDQSTLHITFPPTNIQITLWTMCFFCFLFNIFSLFFIDYHQFKFSIIDTQL